MVKSSPMLRLDEAHHRASVRNLQGYENVVRECELIDGNCVDRSFDDAPRLPDGFFINGKPLELILFDLNDELDMTK